MKHVSLIIVVLSLVFFSCNKENNIPIPEQIAYGSVEGVVLDVLGQPLENSILKLGVHTTKTDTDGKFRIEGIIVGVYRLSASKDSYLTLDKEIEIKKDITLKVTIELEKDPPLQIVEVKGIIGNLEEGASDSVLVVFNKPVDVSRIKSNFDLCHSEIKYSKPDENSVRFTYNCAALGGAYPFTIELKNGFKEDFVVPFYDVYVEVEGLLKDFKLSEDEQYGWMTTTLPNRLYCIDIVNDSVKSAFDLDFEPGKMAYNPYNGYWYVLPLFEKYIDIFSSNIYVINPENGKTVKIITIEPDEYDHPQRPDIHPFSIVFSRDGLGVVTLKNPSTTGGKWQMIESYNDDKMYYHPYFIRQRELALPLDLADLYLNYNNDIIASGLLENSFSFIRKDEVEHYIVAPKFRSDEYYAGGNNTIKRFHKHEDKYYVATAPGSQCIVNVNDDLYSSVLLVESRSASADFSYRPGDHNIVFHQAYVGYNAFHVLDFNKNKVVARFDMIYDLRNVTSLTDGSAVLMTKVDYNRFLTRVFKFQTDIFFN